MEPSLLLWEWKPRRREWNGWGSQQRAVQNSHPGGTWLPGDGRTGTFPEAAFVLQAPHFTWDIWGLLLEVTEIQASDELSLMPPLGYRGQNPGVWLSCSQSVPGVLPGVPGGGGKEEERGERERSIRSLFSFFGFVMYSLLYVQLFLVS